MGWCDSLKCDYWDLDAKDEDVEAEQGQPADVTITQDIYGAVVASSFGGLTQNLGSTEALTFHPFLAFLLCIPLFLVQTNALVALHLDESKYNLTDPIMHNTKHPDGKIPDGQLVNMVFTDQLLCIKLIMVFVLQLSLFGKIMNTTRMLVFLLNPTTWTDVQRPIAADMHMKLKVLFSVPFCAPWPIMAMIFRLLILYQISVDSMSLILATTGIQDAIFDCVAFTFLVELGQYWLECISCIFHLNPFEGFVLRLQFTNDRKKAKDAACIQIPDTCFLHRGNGARFFELCVTFLVIYVMYSRQFMVLLHALKTNVLPIARDTCTLKRWQDSKAEHFQVLANLLRHLLHVTLIVKAEKDIDRVGTYCDAHEEKYKRMKFSDQVEICSQFPGTVAGVGLLVFVFMVVPQFVFAFNGTVMRMLYNSDEDYQKARKATAKKKSLGSKVAELVEQIRAP